MIRQAQLDELFDAVKGTGRHGGLLTVEGAPGAGKTTMVQRVADRFEADGGMVLRSDSSPSETDLPFAALHQLLRPVLEQVADLPPRQRQALLSEFGLAERSEPSDPMLIGIAVLTLLSDVATRRPLLLVVDDGHWADDASLAALSFVVRRLDDEPVKVVVVSRDHAGCGLGLATPTIRLGPLSRGESVRLLDAQPQVPAGLTRELILDQAEGNVLALEELARAAADHGGARGALDTPLRVTDRLERIYAARLEALPPATRKAVVRLATADTDDPPHIVVSWLPDIGDPVWRSAERAGLVRRTGGRLRSAHPLSRIAIYHAAPAGERQAAHVELAQLFRGQDPDRYAWHLAAATSGPSAQVSSELEMSATRARQRSGYTAAAHMLERAADLHPDRSDTTRLLAAATSAATLTGRLDLVQRLAARIRASTDDPTTAALAELQVGRLMTLTASHNAAFEQLLRPLTALADTHPEASLDAMAAAAVVRFYSGEPAQWRKIEGLLPLISTSDDSVCDETPFLRSWIHIVGQPESTKAHVVSRLPELLENHAGQPETVTLLATAAWMVDETDLAVRAFDVAFSSPVAQGSLPDGLGGVAALAYFDHGRWARAHTACFELGTVAATLGLDHAAACSAATEALLLAFGGDAFGARTKALHALAIVDPLDSRSVLAIAHRALGAAAAAEGDHADAYLHYSQLFDALGNPVHYQLSHPALPELAVAAARSGHHHEATGIIDGVASSLDNAGPLGPRRAALVHLSRAVLAPAAEAESHFTQALDSPVLAQRPLELAQALIAYGEWLRRQRRIVEARPSLASATRIFRRLGAGPAEAHAQAELRATGVQATTPQPGALAALTPQQQQIVRLAAQGMTNREVAERLYLSPRTVSSHLYRAFPKLGITVRSQLRDVVEADAERRSNVRTTAAK